MSLFLNLSRLIAQMKRNLTPCLVAFIAVAAALGGCASGKTAATTDDSSNDRVRIQMNEEKSNDPNQVETTTNSGLALVDYLRRVPGLQIDQRGSDVSIMIRGAGSLSGNNNPLFVINNSPIGNSYSDAVSAVDVNDIKTVNVIKGAEGQQLFGMLGANGVIQIFTKKK